MTLSPFEKEIREQLQKYEEEKKSDPAGVIREVEGFRKGLTIFYGVERVDRFFKEFDL